MKQYKFRVKKVLENAIEIKGENHKKVIYELIKLLAFADKEIFENSENAEVEFNISLEEIENLTNKRKIRTSKNVNALLDKINDKLNQNETDVDNEIEDNLPKEYIEIVCEKCGNCIQIDEDELLSE